MRKKPWSWKWKDKAIVLLFEKEEIADWRWFPPWQSSLQSDNADHIVRVLNASFALGKDAAAKIEALAAAGSAA